MILRACPGILGKKKPPGEGGFKDGARGNNLSEPIVFGFGYPIQSIKSGLDLVKPQP
jgi:hypothetical protein